jgi:thiamine pyrophosphate-dependent acetolactate synthase large subunit-like protein
MSFPAPSKERQRMPFIPALEVLAALRRDEIVVTTMGAAREWPRLSQHPLDLHYIPSAMGQAPALGLGLALAQTQREVIILNGDGCQLMNLGVLVTIVASRATNLTLIVFDNGIYEVTGGQQTAAATTEQGVDFAGIARAAGFATVRSFESLGDWQREAASVLGLPGPRFVALAVEPVGASYQLESPGPIAERLARFQQALLGS